MDVESNRSVVSKESQSNVVDFLADLIITKNYQEEKPTDGTVEEGHWIVEGYASTADIDSQDHVITKEALQQGAECLKKYQTLLFNHDPNRPIGYIQLATASDGKLFVKAVISKSEPKIWAQVKDGTLSKFSIFGRIRDDAVENRDGQEVRVIKALELYEVSLVSVPANPEAESLAWYIEKGFRDREAGYSFPLPRVWMEQIIAKAVEQTLLRGVKTAEKQNEVVEDVKMATVKKNGLDFADVIAKLQEQANALVEGSDARMQLEANIRSLTALQKGENTDPDNKKLEGGADKGRTEPTMSHNTPDVHKADVDEVEPAVGAHEYMVALADQLSGEKKAMALKIAKWLEALDVDGGEEDVKAEPVTAKSLGLEKVMDQIKAVAEVAVKAAAQADKSQKKMEEMLSQIPLRKGLLPNKEEDSRAKDEDVDPMDAVRKSIGDVAFNKLHLAERWRIALNQRMLGN